MDPDKLQQSLETTVAALNQAGSIAAIFAPQYAAFIALGMAVDKQIPGIAAAVDRWIQGQPMTDAEKADMVAKLAVLSDPNGP